MWLWIVAAAAAPPAPGEPINLARGLAELAQDQVLPEKVLLEVAAGHELTTVRDAFADLPGAQVEVATRGVIQGWLPVRQLRAAAALPGVRQVRRPRVASPKVVTEGLDVMFEVDWAALGLTGAGQRIAVLDVEFKGYEALLGSELPPSVGTNFRGRWNTGEHGTAVAEIIHDIAPDTQLDFYSFNDEGQFLAAVDDIIRDGHTLVSASIGFDNVWHADGTSVYAAAVDDYVAATGGIWFAAAGNEADMYWVGTLTDTNGDGWMEFGGLGDELPIWGGYELWVTARWDEPFGGAGIDLDLYLWDARGRECSVGAGYQEGNGDPLEETYCYTSSYTGTASLYDYSGRAAGTKAWIYSHYGVQDAAMTGVESLTLPADAHGSTSVAAIDWDTERRAYYSSMGPTNDGRMKPDLGAPTKVTTAVWGAEEFTGTSAATPHASAVAALVHQAVPEWTADEVRTWMLANTDDLGPPGHDTEYGAGLLRLRQPPAPGDTPGGGTTAGGVDTASPGGGGGRGGRGGGGKGGCGCVAAPSTSGWLTLVLLPVLWRRRSR